jgi:hypothetical protein
MSCWRSKMSLLLRLTAFTEVGAGVCLLLFPGAALAFLLGVEQTTAEALLAGRITGAALLSIGIISWLTRDASQPRQRDVVTGITVYTVAAAVLLTYAGVASKMAGILLWPAAAFHAGLAVWCLVCLTGSRR